MTNKITWEEISEYIEVGRTDDSRYAVWSFPIDGTDPRYFDDRQSALEESFYNGYRPICSFEGSLIMKNKNYER